MFLIITNWIVSKWQFVLSNIFENTFKRLSHIFKWTRLQNWFSHPSGAIVTASMNWKANGKHELARYFVLWERRTRSAPAQSKKKHTIIICQSIICQGKTYILRLVSLRCFTQWTSDYQPAYKILVYSPYITFPVYMNKRLVWYRKTPLGSVGFSPKSCKRVLFSVCWHSHHVYSHNVCKRVEVRIRKWVSMWNSLDAKTKRTPGWDLNAATRFENKCSPAGILTFFLPTEWNRTRSWRSGILNQFYVLLNNCNIFVFRYN